MFYMSWSILKAVWNLGLEMAPYLWFGFAVAGLLHVFWPVEIIVRHLGNNSKKAVIKAALLGIPLPLCSCGVLPVATQLRKSRAGAAPTLSFLITTPVTGVDSLLATWALLGGMFTFARLSASVVLGLVIGFLAVLFLKDPNDTQNTTPVTESNVCTTEKCSISSGLHDAFWYRLSRVITYGFWELPSSMATSVLLGLLLGGIITSLIPASLITDHIGTGFVGVFVAVAVAVPLYVCATGSIPIAAVLMLKGFSPGAALAFLIAGPASNAVAFTTVQRLLGSRHLALYLGVIFVGALSLGMLFDLVISVAGLQFSVQADVAHEMYSAVFWGNFIAGVALFSVLGLAVILPFVSKLQRRFHRKQMYEEPMNIKEKSIILSVPDMNCTHCKTTVSKLISAEPGVHAIEVNLEKRTVAIFHNDTFIAESVLRKLADAGYPSQIVIS